MYKVKSFFDKLFDKLFRGSEGNPPEDVVDDSETNGIGPGILHNGCVDPSTGVDLVFVHGLRVSRVKTRSTGEYFWPKDLLSVDVKSARIITWG